MKVLLEVNYERWSGRRYYHWHQCICKTIVQRWCKI